MGSVLQNVFLQCYMLSDIARRAVCCQENVSQDDNDTVPRMLCASLFNSSETHPAFFCLPSYLSDLSVAVLNVAGGPAWSVGDKEQDIL